MGRKIHVAIKSAKGLKNPDGGGDIADPFVVICFDSKVSQELGRTKVVPNTQNPTWNYKEEIDVSSAIKKLVESGNGEPKMLTFCVYDADTDKARPLGIAGISFQELNKLGEKEGDFPVFYGTGSVNAHVKMKKKSDKDWAKVAGGVAVGATALGIAGALLYNKDKKKKEGENGEGSSSKEDGKGKSNLLKKWWEESSSSSDEEKTERRKKRH